MSAREPLSYHTWPSFREEHPQSIPADQIESNVRCGLPECVSREGNALRSLHAREAVFPVADCPKSPLRAHSPESSSLRPPSHMPEAHPDNSQTSRRALSN